jgi:hypothetical protein
VTNIVGQGGQEIPWVEKLGSRAQAKKKSERKKMFAHADYIRPKWSAIFFRLRW